MKKILLITLYGESNFGNRLQNYALQTVLKDIGFSADSLVVKNLIQLSALNRIKLFVKSMLVSLGVKKYTVNLAAGKRTEKFLVFRNKYFENILVCPRSEVENHIWSDYDFAITGSDQVWHNWGSIENELDYYYLSFLEKRKRISYAPSFGFSQFPKQDIEAHRRGLAGMQALSCREQEGCELIRELTGLEAQRVLDPTLLLTRDQWNEIKKKPSFQVPNKYLLVFFLGDITEEYRKEINRIKAEKSLVSININDPNDLRHYAISPDEFIWLIQHADIVCTDSFHCSVFSILFNRGLRVFERAGKLTGMFGRIRDLLELFGLKELAYGCGDEKKYSTSLTPEANERYLTECRKSLDYLKNALEIE